MLSRKTYFIREHVGVFKLSDTYDILDPETHNQLGIAKEKPGTLVHVLRFLVEKRILPTKVFVYEGSDFDDPSRLLFSIQRGFTFLRSKVDICDTNGVVLGWLKSKLFTIGGAFYVYDSSGNEVAFVQENLVGWTFKFLDREQNEIGTITKKWAGVGKEMFTSADNYMIALNDEPSPAKAILMLAAGLAVDIIYKEK
jgi:uncharacterized protein YxjI